MDDNLPPMPGPFTRVWRRVPMGFTDIPVFDADQMRAYAAEAVRVERERIEVAIKNELLTDDTGTEPDRAYNRAIEHCLAAIRNPRENH